MWLFKEVLHHIHKLCRMETPEDGIWVLSWFVSNSVYIIMLEDSLTLLKNFHLHLHISNHTSALQFIWTKSNFLVSGQSDFFFNRFLCSNKRHISFHFFTKASLMLRFPKSVFFCFCWNVSTKVPLCNCLFRLHTIIIHQFQS